MTRNDLLRILLQLGRSLSPIDHSDAGRRGVQYLQFLQGCIQYWGRLACGRQSVGVTRPLFQGLFQGLFQ